MTRRRLLERRRWLWTWGAISLLAFAWASGCTRQAQPEVVVYTALDNVFSREIFGLFEARTGIRVKATFDTEATKTTGLVERIRRERGRPRCDVFWNNELLRTIQLGREGLLAPYHSPAAADIPERYRSREGLWTAFAARARALAYRRDRLPADRVPRTYDDLWRDEFVGQIALADPRFGTTGSHLAILCEARGEAWLRLFLERLRDHGVRMVSGNASSRDRVLSGEVALGFTDTDDIEVARRQGEPIGCALIEGDGTVVIPNAVALIKGGPHPSEAQRFIDFLLSPEIEERLAASSSRQIPVRGHVPVPETGLALSDLSVLDCDYERAATLLPRALELAREILGR